MIVHSLAENEVITDILLKFDSPCRSNANVSLLGPGQHMVERFGFHSEIIEVQS